MLRTNQNTYAFLSDLNLAISETRGAQYAIIPRIFSILDKRHTVESFAYGLAYFRYAVKSNHDYTARKVYCG